MDYGRGLLNGTLWLRAATG